MSAIDKTPDTKNFLSPLNFQFVLKRSPSLNFFVQSINVPGIALGAFFQPSPTLNIPMPGDHLEYSDLRLTFKVDEDFQNYFEIFNWLKGLSYPETQQDYYNLQKKTKSSGETIKSDISIIIMNGIKNPNYEVVIKDAFPIALSDLEFQTTDDSVNYISTTVTFKYTYYDIIKI
jgi:hypothetical protein